MTTALKAGGRAEAAMCVCVRAREIANESQRAEWQPLTAADQSVSTRRKSRTPQVGTGAREASGGQFPPHRLCYSFWATSSRREGQRRLKR